MISVDLGNENVIFVGITSSCVAVVIMYTTFHGTSPSATVMIPDSNPCEKRSWSHFRDLFHVNLFFFIFFFFGSSL